MNTKINSNTEGSEPIQGNNHDMSPKQPVKRESKARIFANVQAIFVKFDAEDNDPEMYRETVRVGLGADLLLFRRCLLEGTKMDKVRVSEIICILKSPEVALDFTAEKLTVREALTKARNNRKKARKVQTSNHPNQSATSQKEPAEAQLERTLGRLEKALEALNREMEKAGQNGAYAIKVGAYCVRFEPARALPDTTASEATPISQLVTTS